MNNEVNYKKKFYINVGIILVQVIISFVLFIKNNNNWIVGQNPCATRFNCGSCQNGKLYCSTLDDYGNIYDIECPCEDN